MAENDLFWEQNKKLILEIATLYGKVERVIKKIQFIHANGFNNKSIKDLEESAHIMIQCIAKNKQILERLEKVCTPDQINLIHNINDVYTKSVEVIERIRALPYAKELELEIPSINELRYAGRHLLDAIASMFSDIDKAFCIININSELNESLDHCKRALFDAYEMGLLYNIKEIQYFKDDFKYDCDANCMNIIMETAAIQEEFSELSRQDHIADKFVKIENCFKKSRELAVKLNEYRMPLAIAARRRRRKYVVSTIFAICAIITACVTVASFFK